MKKHKPQKMFAAFDTHDPWILGWTMRGSAAEVRRVVGIAWDKDDPADGWKAAKIEGMRVVKVELRICS